MIQLKSGKVLPLGVKLSTEKTIHRGRYPICLDFNWSCGVRRDTPNDPRSEARTSEGDISHGYHSILIPRRQM